MRLADLAARRPLSAFLFLAFAIPWALWGWLIITTPAGALLRTGPTPVFMIFALLGGMGPTLAALAVRGLGEGGAGIRRLLAVGLSSPGWLPALGALVSPAAFNLIWFLLCGLWLIPLSLGDFGGRLVLGLIWPFFSSLGEEFGWRGFALPRLQDRIGSLGAALVVGGLWGLWHLPADYLGIGDQVLPLFLANFLLLGPLMLTAHSVIMTWILNRTRSLGLVILWHYGITFSAIVLAPQQVPPHAVLAVNAIAVVVAWAAAAAVMVATRGRLGRP